MLYTLAFDGSAGPEYSADLLQVFVGSFRGKGFGPGGTAGPARGPAAPAAAPAPASCKQARLLLYCHLSSQPGMQPSCTDVTAL